MRRPTRWRPRSRRPRPRSTRCRRTLAQTTGEPDACRARAHDHRQAAVAQRAATDLRGADVARARLGRRRPGGARRRRQRHRTRDAPRRAPAPWSVQRRARSLGLVRCGCWTGEARAGTSCRNRPDEPVAAAPAAPTVNLVVRPRPASPTAGCHAPHHAGPSLACSRGASVRRAGERDEREMTTTAERTGLDQAATSTAGDPGPRRGPVRSAGRREGHLLPLEEQRGAGQVVVRRQRPRPARRARRPGPLPGGPRPAGFQGGPAARPPARSRPSATTTGSTGPPDVSSMCTRTSGSSSATTRPRTSGCRSRRRTSPRAPRTGCCPCRPPSTSSPCWCCGWCSSTRPGTPSSSGAGRCPPASSGSWTGCGAVPTGSGPTPSSRPTFLSSSTCGRPVAARSRAAAPGSSALRAADRLVRALESCARRPRAKDTALRVTRRVTWRLEPPPRAPAGRQAPGRRRCGRRDRGGRRRRQEHGRRGAARWLSGPFAVERVHLGRPPNSLATVAVKIALSAGPSRAVCSPTWPRPRCLPPTPPSTAWLLWHVCTARDRRRAYVRARRVAAEGGVVVCDRFPLAQLRSMDGPARSPSATCPGMVAWPGG